MCDLSKRSFIIKFIIIFLPLPALLFSQEKKQMILMRMSDTPRIKIKDTIISNQSVPQKDVLDIAKQLFKKHTAESNPNGTITSKPVFTAVPAVGYTLQSKLVATISGNVVFHFNQTANLSTITASAAYTQRKQFTLPIESNIWTKGNKFNLVGDFRFYKYPQSTYGLGSSSDVKNENQMDYSYFRFYEMIQKKIAGNFFAGAGYILDYHWNISEKGTNTGTVSDYKKYGTATHTRSAGITLNALYDIRDNPINPSKGFYTNIQYRHNYIAFGSTSNWQSLIIDVRKYIPFPGASENVLALWSYDWLVLKGKPPYLDLPSNGWDSYSSTGRGYIQGRFRGVQMVYAETEYRFKITRNGLFGGVLFANAETFSAGPGTALETIQPGFGPGLRIKLNKVSKTNISIDYGFGSHGSKGLFINIGELF